MGDTTAISWTDHTWNPWTGCTRISAGCANCYADREQRRYGRDPWKVTRTGKGTWDKPWKWQREAIIAQAPRKVFVCSWSDFFHPDADQWRDDAWHVIRNTGGLRYQIPTKRPERIADSLPGDWPLPNVWLGVSIESNTYVHRADILREIPAAVRFVSYEPALGPVDELDLTGIDWLIYGGESGPGRRPDNAQWARDIRDRCQAAGVAFFFKQRSGPKQGTNPILDGESIKQYPAALYQTKGR